MRIYKKLKVLCIVKDLNSTIFKIRIKTPLELWKKKFRQNVKFINLENISETNLFWPDIIIFQRTISDNEIRLAKFLIKNKKKIVYEIDDLLTRIPLYLSRTNFTINKLNIIKIISISNALSVSTCNLKTQFKNKNSNIHVTPNYSLPMKRISKHYFVRTKDIKLIISSTDNVLLNMIIPALLEVQKKFGVQIISIGPICLQLKKAGIRIDENLILRYYEFKKFISKIDNAIGLIPLNFSSFNNCKSPIKFFDYSACGIPSICSNVPPYSQIIKRNFSGLLAENTKKSWIKNICQLIKDENLRSFLSKNAIIDIEQNYNINKNVKSWNNLLFSIKISNIFEKYKNRKKMLKFIPQTNFNFLMTIFFKNIFNTYFYRKIFRLLRELGLREFYYKIFYSKKQ